MLHRPTYAYIVKIGPTYRDRPLDQRNFSGSYRNVYLIVPIGLHCNIEEKFFTN